MKVTGIIAECNPLHEGHKYLLQEARKNTGADYIVIAMSGDYVQRGAPAVVSKEQRACALLQNGADLVLELPLYVSASGADYFARGGVSLLESLGVVTDLAFGSESGDLSLLQDAARELNEDTEAFREVLQNGLRKGGVSAGTRPHRQPDPPSRDPPDGRRICVLSPRADAEEPQGFGSLSLQR